jgi:hypothetical protein
MATDVATQVRAAIQQITPEELIGYLSTVSAGTKKGTFYNLSDEQVNALNGNINKMITVFRPFAALMTLSPSITFDARIATAMQLFSAPSGDKNIAKWETTIIRESLAQMPVTRVFDLFHYLIGFRRVKEDKKTVMKRVKPAVGGKFVKGMIKQWMADNARRLDLWSVKYKNDFQKVAKHQHLGADIFDGVEFLFGGAPTTPLQKKLDKVRKAAPDAIPPELWQLPYENARGYALNKFKMSKEDFEKEFSGKGQKTVKEARTSAKRTKAAGGEVTFDPAKSGSLFDLFVYIGGQDTIPGKARQWVKKVAEKEASRIGMGIRDTAVIVDTSLSMFGARDTKRHPLYKAMAIARLLEKSCSGKFKIFYTDPVLPNLHGATTYAYSLLEAIKEGFKKIFLVGDGYENAPEGLTHRVLYAFKKKIDKNDEVAVIHLNPVQAAESLGVREMSPYAPAAGINKVEGISSAVFTALAKTYPIKALEAYFAELCSLQSTTTRALMPPQYQKLLEG